MMMDQDVVAASPSSVYRVLQTEGLLARWNRSPSRKGAGFQQPLKPHEHWHTDLSYLNIQGTFYYLCSVLDGFSRYILHWEIREAMTEARVQIVLQRAREDYPEAKPRLISDNGPQFIAKDFKEFIRLSGMTHVRTSPYYPQSNGKQERWHATLKRECIRPQTPLCADDARRVVADFVDHYNTVRLHSAIGYLTPKDKLEGRAEAILAERERKLHAARERRAQMRRASEQRPLTERKEQSTLRPVGQTEAGNAGERPARDNRPGRRITVQGESSDSPALMLTETRSVIRSPSMPLKTPGSGAEPQRLVNR
jgi:transposase InsO family protein